MKIISASFAFTAVYADLISYRLRESVTQMGSLFLSNSTFAAQLSNHGCWCAKIADQGPTSASLGGNQPIDELDQICKDWARVRRCSRATGSSCEFADFTSAFEIEVATQSCVDSDACLSETCQIDFSFISAIEAWRNSNSGSFSPVTNPVCPAHTSSQMINCVEFVTTPAPTTSETTTAATTTTAPTPTGVAKECSIEIQSQGAIDYLTANTNWGDSCDFSVSSFGECILTYPSTTGYSFTMGGVDLFENKKFFVEYIQRYCVEKCWVKNGIACRDGTVEVAEPTGDIDFSTTTTTTTPAGLAKECSIEIHQGAIDYLTVNTDWADSCDFSVPSSGECIITYPSTSTGYSFTTGGVACVENCWVKNGIACRDGTVEVAEPTRN